jgi:crossover junction endodeoxyribonuclease RuvC
VIDRIGGDLRWVAHGVLRPLRTASLPARLATLAADLAMLVKQHRPDIACVEDVFVSTNARSALVLGHARGVALATLGAAAIPLVEYAPTRIKQGVTGSGRAATSQVQRSVRRLLTLDRMPPTDAADALAAAICHANAGAIEGWKRPARRRPTRGGATLRVRRAR